MKKLNIIFILTAILGLVFITCQKAPNPVEVQPSDEIGFHIMSKGGAEPLHFRQDFKYFQKYTSQKPYEHWGPACYYKKHVKVEYTGIVEWTRVVKKGKDFKNNFIRQNLVINGTAKIYNINEKVPFDERPFHVSASLFDSGYDAVIGTPKDAWFWPLRKPPDIKPFYYYWWNPKLEGFHYVWKIPGIYEYRMRNSGGGDYSFSWKSGNCEGFYPPQKLKYPSPPDPTGCRDGINIY